MIYLSLVGTQALAVLNPLLALLEKDQKPDEVMLLATAKTRQTAERITGYLRKEFEPGRIKIADVSGSLEKDAQGRPPVHEIIGALAPDAALAFNLGGGLNFQVAACVNALTPARTLFLYPETECIHAVRIGGDRVESHERWLLPGPVGVLRLQNIPFERCDAATHRLERFIKACDLSIPRKTYKIGNVTFDLIRNVGNHLKFMTSIWTTGKKMTPEKALRQARNVLSLAENRDDFGELYHMSIAVLTNSRAIRERIETEGRGKVSIIFCDKYPQSVCETIRSFLQAPITAAPMEKRGIQPPLKPGPTLYAALGRNLMPTLLALWSHTVENACLLYTPADPEVLKLKERLETQAALLPRGLASVSFFPVSISGAEILNMPGPAEPAQARVNITPGTKGQTGFLTLWAKKYSLPVFSIENREGVLAVIPAGRKTPLDGPPLIHFLKLTGVALKCEGREKKDLLEDKSLTAALTFIRRMITETGGVDRGFPEEAIILKAAQCKPADENTCEISIDGGPPVTLAHRGGGHWFERLIGRVLAECGADDVRVGVKSRWSKPAEVMQKEKYNRINHLSDMDVLARFQATYYGVECKATVKQGETRFADQVKSVTATYFERFAVPLLCFLHYAGKPKLVNNVYVFGHNTFADPDAMKALLDRAVAERRKTNG